QPLEGAGASTCKFLMRPDFGPAAVVVKAPGHATLAMPPAEFGRYEVVLEGCVIMEGREIGPPGVRYIRGEQAAHPLGTGGRGASVSFLTIDRDALGAGVTGERLAGR